MFGHVHVCRTPDAERVQVLCKWCATCASGLLHCATARCTLSSHISFRSGCAWATVPDAEAKGGGDEPDGDGIAVSSGAGEGVMEPNGDGDRDAQKMDEGESPPKADEEMVCTDAKEGTKEEDEPMQEGEQGEAKPTEDVNDKPATPSETSVAVAEEGKSDEAPKTNTPNKEGLDATQKLWSSPPPQ